MENKKLSKKESELIRRYTSVYEYEFIAEKLKTSTSKVQHLVYGYTKITDSNKEIFEELKKQALINCEKIHSESIGDVRRLNVL